MLKLLKREVEMGKVMKIPDYESTNQEINCGINMQTNHDIAWCCH